MVYRKKDAPAKAGKLAKNLVEKPKGEATKNANGGDAPLTRST